MKELQMTNGDVQDTTDADEDADEDDDTVEDVVDDTEATDT